MLVLLKKYKKTEVSIGNQIESQGTKNGENQSAKETRESKGSKRTKRKSDKFTKFEFIQPPEKSQK